MPREQHMHNAANRIKPMLTAMARSFAGVVLIHGFLMMSVYGDAQRDEKVRLLSSALRAHDAGDYEAAKRNLDSLVKIAPENKNVQRLYQIVNERLNKTNVIARNSDSSTAPAKPRNIDTGPTSFSNEPAPFIARAEGAIDQFMAQTALAQKDAIQEAERDLNLAKVQSSTGEYAKAIQFLDQVQAKLPLNTATVKLVQEIHEARLRFAMRWVKRSKSLEPREITLEILERYKTLFGDTSHYRYLAKEAEKTVSSPLNRSIATISPKFVKDQAEVKELVTRARAQFLKGDYQGATQSLKEAEVRDPSNKEVKMLLIHIADKQAFISEMQHDTTRYEMLEAVNRAWQRPQIFEVKKEEEDSTITENPTLRKLRSIIFPDIEFKNTPLDRVIQQLSELSVQHDHDSPDNKKGVNMFIGPGSDGLPDITLKLRNASLDKILHFVTQSVGYQYFLEDEAILIHKGSSNAILETEFFPLPRATVVKMTGAPSTDPAGSSKIDTETKIRGFLEKAGLSFSTVPGSTMAYDGAQIIVTHTPRNLDRLKNLLRRYSDVKQVQVEARFMDIKEGVLEELGYNWDVRYLGAGLKTRDLVDRNGGSNFRQLGEAFNSRSSPANGSISDFADNTFLDLGNNLPAFPNATNYGDSSINTFAWNALLGRRANLEIRALEQHDGVEVLTAAKTTLLSGTSSRINVSQELMYPTSYGDVEAEVGNSGALITFNPITGEILDIQFDSTIAITPGTPEDIETEEIGVTLDVSAEVEENDSITLSLKPKVTGFEGFIEYGGDAIATVLGARVSVPPGFFLPVFSKREIETEVTLFDGATVVLGGLTQEESLSVDDRVPFFSDVPLVGRLLKNEGTAVQKRNLLIFVTANLISPSGAPSSQSYKNVRAHSLFQNPVIMTPSGSANREVTEE